MKALFSNFNMVTILLLSVFFSLSCSNDKDLLADAILLDSSVDENIVVNDYFVIQPDNSIVLNVLSNDGFSEDDNVQIIDISSPTHGSVEINDDNMTITYTPQGVEDVMETAEETELEEVETEFVEEAETQGSEDEEQETLEESSEEVTSPMDELETKEEVETEDGESSIEEETLTDEDNQPEENAETIDTFTYTTEVVNEDQSTSTEEGTVEVVIDSSGEDEDTITNSTDEEETTPEEDEDENSSTSEEGSSTTDEEGENSTNTNGTQTASLLFSSGFEGINLSNQNYDYRYIQGTDSDTGFSWPPKILGSTGAEQEPSGIHTINDGGQSTITNRLETVVGHNGNQTTALYQGIEGTAGVTQTPYQINNIKENPDELYITYWMKIDNTSLSGAHKWRALWEYKTDNYGSGGGFRMIAFIYTDNNGKAYWNFQGDRNPSNAVWEKPNFDIPVPREEWFKVEYYFKWSEGADGRAFMKVNGQLVGEHHGATTANSKDLDFIILTQVYGDTSPMHQWVDDIEIWNGLPY